MGELFHTDDYVSWFSYLFVSHGYVWIGLVAAMVSLGLFAVGYGISLLGGFAYPKVNTYFGVFAVFAMLAALGVADRIYVDVWNDIRRAFDVDDETYRAVVHPRLEQIHDEKRILASAVALAAPYFYITTVSYTPLDWPLRNLALEYFYSGELVYDTGILSVVVICLFGAVAALLIATIVNGFVVQLTLAREVSALPFRDIYTSASDLEPLAIFTIASATAWFAATSLIILWMQIGLGMLIGWVMVALLVLTGIVFFLAPQLVLHDALRDAKRNKVVDIQREYRELHTLARQDTPSDSLSLRLELVDRRLENAQSISTWVYNASSLSKLVAASVIPWLTLIQEFGKTLNFLG
jgi:hypothetical protein